MQEDDNSVKDSPRGERIHAMSHSMVLRNLSPDGIREMFEVQTNLPKKFKRVIMTPTNKRVIKEKALEYEDALDYLLRKRESGFKFNFKEERKAMTPNPKRTRRRKKKDFLDSPREILRKKPQPIIQKALDYDDIIAIARRRRNRRHQDRLKIAKFRHNMSNIAPPVELIGNKFPEDLIGYNFRVGHFKMQGRRPYQEDMVVACVKSSEDECSILGVFDGHIGAKASTYCQKRMAEIIRKNIKNNKNVKQVLKNSFRECNEEIKENNIKDGTCASVVVIFKNKLYAANVGDSEIYLFKKNSLKKLSEDHNPNNKKEVKRIEQLGGKICGGRIGLLNITRALGDNFNNLISHEPFTTSVELSKNCLSVVLASDGVWNFVSPKEIRKIILESNDPRRSAEKIRNLAFSNGSKDNISVVVVHFEKKEKHSNNSKKKNGWSILTKMFKKKQKQNQKQK